MKPERVAELIREEAKGRIFSVRFTKRTTGETRDMLCRLGVAKNIKGTGQKFDPLSKGLLVVFDMQKNGYRSIPLDAIEKLTINGVTYN